MSATELQVIFEGQAVESGKIDARVLGTSLTAYSEVFQRANALANGEASEAVVLVESNFQKGSFDVNLQLVQNIVETAKALITAHPFLTAGELAAAIGFIWSKRESLMSVLKWLKGEKPEKITQEKHEFHLIDTLVPCNKGFDGKCKARGVRGARPERPSKSLGVRELRLDPTTVRDAADGTGPDAAAVPKQLNVVRRKSFKAKTFNGQDC